MRHRWLRCVVPVLVLCGLAACTGGPPPRAGAARTADPERPFIACMQARGIQMPDPSPGDTSGRSSVRYALDVLGLGSDPNFQAALDKCQSLLPPAPAASPAAPEVADQRLVYARCMRAHGLGDFPDPDPDGQFPSYWVRGGDPAAAAAAQACGQLNPPDVSPSGR